MLILYVYWQELEITSEKKLRKTKDINNNNNWSIPTNRSIGCQNNIYKVLGLEAT